MGDRGRPPPDPAWIGEIVTGRVLLLKYLAGPEIGGGDLLSDTSPDENAAELRALPDVHYAANAVG